MCGNIRVVVPKYPPQIPRRRWSGRIQRGQPLLTTCTRRSTVTVHLVLAPAAASPANLPRLQQVAMRHDARAWAASMRDEILLFSD